MQKLKVLVTINNQQELVTANYNKEKEEFFYIEKDSNQTVTIYNEKENSLKRDNSQMYMELYFIEKKTTKNKLWIKEFNQSLELEIYTEKITTTKTKKGIEYYLNKERYQYQIEIMEELQ